MKFFITLILCFFALFLIAQPQKGDWYFENSRAFVQQTTFRDGNDVLSLRNNLIGILPEFGLMVDNHLLFGLQLSSFRNTSENFFIDSTVVSGNTNLEVFGTYYFGKRKFRPFAIQRAGVSFKHQEETPVGLRSFSWLTRVGAALFLNESTELSLSYEVLLQGVVRGEQEWFPDKFRPKFDLGIKQFFLRTRAAGMRPIALDFIKKGIFRAGGNGYFSMTENFMVCRITPDTRYFFKDGFYFGLRGNYQFIRTRKELRRPNTINRYFFRIAPEFGFYLPVLNERIYLTARLNPEFGYDKAGIVLVTSSEEDFSDRLSVTTLGLGFEIGVGLFVGRHKLTPSVLWRTFNKRPEGFATAAQTYNSPVFIFDYEIFLTKNFSINPTFNFFSKQKSVFFRALNNLDDITVGTIDQNRSNLDFGFKWYIRGSSSH